MDDAVSRAIEQLGPATLRAVEISGSAHAGRGWAAYESWRYPDFDLCQPLATHGRQFDVAIAEQVLEHVPDPAMAMANLTALVRPGGWVVVTTPFLVRLHHEPDDYWRFSPSGLRRLAENQGLRVVELGQWGNASALRGNLRSWAVYRRWHSLANDPDLPLVVWMICCKAP